MNFHASEFSAPSYVWIFRAHTRRRGLPSRRRKEEGMRKKEGRKEGRKEGGKRKKKEGLVSCL